MIWFCIICLSRIARMHYLRDIVILILLVYTRTSILYEFSLFLLCFTNCIILLNFYTCYITLAFLGEYAKNETNSLFFFFFLRAARCYWRARERENCKHRPGRPSLHPRFSPPRVFSTGYRTSTRQPPSYGITWDTRPGASSNYRGFRLPFCSNLRPMSPIPFLTKVSNDRRPRVQLTGRFYFWMNKTRASEYFRHISIITLLLVVRHLNQFN